MRIGWCCPPAIRRQVRSRAQKPCRASRAPSFMRADRKSTRLNSSHLGISYAVFCRRPLSSSLFPYTTLFRSPSLALTLPNEPSELDDGLLTASEVAQLKLNADWVVLSTCNTAAGEKPGAEALSGLARAFFYAG